MNETLNVLETRRSVRGFDPERIPSDELIEQVVRAGEYAPTGRGMQSPRIVVVTNKAVRDKLSQLNAEVMGVESDPFYGAPVIILVLADRSRPTYIYDGSLVMGNLMNAAHAVGLGSCWITVLTKCSTPLRASCCSPHGASRATTRASATWRWAMR